MKIVLVGLTCFVLGFGAFYTFNRFQEVQKENAILKEQIDSTIESKSQDQVLQPTTSETIQQNEKGSITGTLGYPSSGIPPLEIYAYNKKSNDFIMISTKQNQMEFTISDVPSGMYHVVAYTADGDLSGGYTKAVACGLSVDCTDHSLVDVEVKAGAVTQDVEVKDWYAPEGTFPKKP